MSNHIEVEKNSTGTYSYSEYLKLFTDTNEYTIVEEGYDQLANRWAILQNQNHTLTITVTPTISLAEKKNTKVQKHIGLRLSNPMAWERHVSSKHSQFGSKTQVVSDSLAWHGHDKKGNRIDLSIWNNKTVVYH